MCLHIICKPDVLLQITLQYNAMLGAKFANSSQILLYTFQLRASKLYEIYQIIIISNTLWMINDNVNQVLFKCLGRTWKILQDEIILIKSYNTKANEYTWRRSWHCTAENETINLSKTDTG